jgi:hypothetical protein
MKLRKLVAKAVFWEHPLIVVENPASLSEQFSEAAEHSTSDCPPNVKICMQLVSMSISYMP